MSTNINRYKPDNDGRLWPSHDGEYVLYADHVAALALIPGEAVAVWRKFENGNNYLDIRDKELFASSNEIELFASTPAPLPVAVKAKKLPSIGEELYEHYSVMSAQTHEALVKEYARKAIRSALSSPVGGMGERAPIRISAHEYAMEYEFRADEGDYVPTDGERAMIEDAINGFLSENEISPVPASDIAALREENENFRRSLAMIANTPAWGAPDKWETTPAEVRQLARNAIAKTGSQS